MPLLDLLYGNSNGGIRRLRGLQTVFHMLCAVTVYYVSWSLTQNSTAAFVAGLLYAFYGTSPDLTAGSFNFEQFYIPFILIGLIQILRIIIPILSLNGSKNDFGPDFGD